MRSRDLDRLAGDTYDLLVIGGGVYGLTIAYEAASRGLSVALIDGKKPVRGATKSSCESLSQARSSRWFAQALLQAIV